MWARTAEDRSPPTLMDEIEGDSRVAGAGAGTAGLTTMACLAKALNDFCRMIERRYGEKAPRMRELTPRFDKWSTLLSAPVNSSLPPSKKRAMPLLEPKPAADQSWHDAQWFQEWLQLARRDYHGRS